MDFLRQQFVIVQERLAGLSPSQKMLAGALVVIMAMTMLYWGKFASTQDSIALLPSGTTEAQLAPVQAALQGAGIPFELAGGQLRVAADKQLEAISAISFADAMPSSDGVNPLEAMLDKINPWSMQSEFSERMKVGHVDQIKQAIKLFPGVSTVKLNIRESTQAGLTASPAGVSIVIKTKGNAQPKKIANAAMNMVLPIIANLARQDISVNVDGVDVIKPGSADGSFASNDLFDIKSLNEAAACESIRKAYNILGFTIEVTAEVSAERKQATISTVDPTKKISMPLETTSEKTTTTEARQPAEPGVVPNTGLDATAAIVGPAAGSKTERTEEKNEVAFGKSTTEVFTPAGTAKIVSAIARVPRDYFLKEWKGRHKAGLEPEPEEFEQYVKTNLEDIRNGIKVKLQIADIANVSVSDVIGDPVDTTLVAAADAASSAGGSLSLLAGSHGKEVAIGGLALTSLFMVGRMVKKSAPTPTAPLLTLDDMPDVSSGKKGRKTGPLGGLDIAGEVAEGGQIMMGQELDEEVLETAQMVEQVSGFVKDNPDMTAQLLKRWMSRE